MQMSNEEYLDRYVEWKDMVNTEDVDTPDRFALYLRDQRNKQTIDALKVLVGQRLDELDGHTGEIPSAVLREYLDVATLLGLDTEWYRSKKELEAPSE